MHEQHGIGRYLGLVTMDMGEGATEFLSLEYEGETNFTYPSPNCTLSEDTAELHPKQLPCINWAAASGIRPSARRCSRCVIPLLNCSIFMLSAVSTGHAFSFRQQDYEAFVEGFGFEETADQAAAIEP